MAGAIVKITRNFQVTLPKYVRKLLGLDEGDLVSFEFLKDGRVVLTPLRVTKKEQAYYWTEEWQNDAILAKKEAKEGKVKKFKTVKNARKDLGD